MTIDESEINRLRFEDLSQSLQDLINNLASYNDEEYITLRRHVSEISDNVALFVLKIESFFSSK